MITVAEIKKKSENLYCEYLKSIISGESFFPKTIRSDKSVSIDFNEMRNELAEVIEHSKDRKNFGYTITYTIMGAAIAYQYGILKDGMNTNSFRFICVDEAFAKQDEEKADYLMDLAKKLNLQMLLVTPDDKIQIAEPYISGVHIVHRVNNRNSRIFDTTIEQAKKIIAEKTLETSDYSS